MPDPKPTPSVSHEEAIEAFVFIARCTIPAGVDLYESIRKVGDYFAQQKAASATRQADVETVRPFVLTADGSQLMSDVKRALEALDRLGKE